MSKLDKRKLRSFIRRALDEDVKDGDHTSNACILPSQLSKAKLLIKDEGVIAGVEIAKYVFEYLDPLTQFEIYKDDGSEVHHGDIAFQVQCNTRSLLKGERLVLNLMQRLSGIATLSRAFYTATRDWPVTILDTRKTTPLLRFLEKWAVSVGGCSNYREGLYDRIMIKDNHIDAAGGISKAVERINAYLIKNKKSLEMTIEVRNFDELEKVLALQSHPRIMLDNFSLEDLKIAVKRINKRNEIEASGGIELNTVRDFAATGVNYISVGALTHSAQSLDLSLKIIK